MELSTVVSGLQKSSCRITKVRKKILQIFLNSKKPINIREINVLLKGRKVKVNKTTVYREIAFLVKQNLIKEIYIESGIAHFELTNLPHHHHLICSVCKSIDKVDTPQIEKEVKKFIGLISRRRGFRTTDHSLEFHGTCVNCQQ
jgi:Fur family ferric uptake transcriptional regulator